MYIQVLFCVLPEICLLFRCRRVASVRAVTVCDLYSLDRGDFDIILGKFPKMKQRMHDVAQERLMQLQDTYGPGWLSSEHSDADISHTLLLQRPSRTREYLRRIEASRSSALQSSSFTITGMHGVGQSMSSQSSAGRALGVQTSSSQSVPIDVPLFTHPENVV